jgi:hypothetical protein
MQIQRHVSRLSRAAVVTSLGIVLGSSFASAAVVHVDEINLLATAGKITFSEFAQGTQAADQARPID